ncbi:MAG: cytochrome c, partial [Chloroflexota bacterium]
FNTPDLARTTSPERWFTIITDGNLERVMPPWNGSLTESQRWSLVAYLYSLSAESNIESGQAVYEANCANCHGSSGQGDGPDANGSLSSFGDQAFMAAKSNDDFFAALTDGISGEHKFTETLGEDERWAAVDYVRAFSYDSTGLAAAPGEAASGTVSGTITNGTPDADIPGDQPVVLHLFDNFQETGTITTTVTSGGAFEFTDVELVTDRAMIVSARYGEVLYTSDVALVVAGQTEYQLPIQIFEATADPNVIVVERMHVILDFQAGEAQIGELFIIGNTGDKTFVSASPDGPTFSAALPAGFTNLTFQDDVIGGRYQQTTAGFADTLPIRPGAGAQQILLSFNLPYADALDFSQKLSYSTSAVSVLLPDNGVTLSGEGLLDEGLRDVQGANYRTFGASDLPANSNFSFSLKGEPALAVDAASGSSSAATPTFDLRAAIIGGLSLALVVGVIAYWWIQRGSARS